MRPSGDPPAIVFDRVSLTYPQQSEPALSGVELEVAEGELCLVVGATGSGKSTLLGAVNGLVPHFSGGLLQGRVLVAGRDTADHHPRDLAEVVGVVGQDPLAGFVTDTVEEELAYAMEQLGTAPEVMRKRVEETLDLLGIAELRSRALRDLSGGQQQRVAIGAALTAQPRVLVLDEPTSALDPTAAEEVLAAVTRLVHDLGVTVVMAEHRLERVVQYADLVVQVREDRTVRVGEPAEVMHDCPVAPPVVRLGRLAGWTPVPLSVRDARRRAAELRTRLEGVAPPGHDEVGTGDGDRPGRGRPGRGRPGRGRPGRARPGRARPGRSGGPAALSAREVTVCHGPVVAVRGVSVELPAGEVTALMGRNGSGKSSLLWALQGAGARQGGRVEVAGRDPGEVRAADARRLVGLVPQSPTDLLYLVRVGDECRRADHDAGAPEGTCRTLLDSLVDGVPDGANPRDLSEGQRLAVALAVQLSAAPTVVLLDEPTRGLDYGAKDRLGTVVRDLAGAGRAVVVATHDVEFAAEWADRVLVMAEGEVVADGPTAEVVVASASLAPQVAKVLHPQPWLTVGQVADALGLGGSSPALDLRDPQGTNR